MVFGAAAALLPLGAGAQPPPDPGAATRTAIIQARVDQMRNGVPVKIGSETLASMVVLPDFYERRVFRPAWTEPRARTGLLEALQTSTADGLEPRDYHVPALETLLQAAPTPETDADIDMLATDGILRLAYHLRFGKVDVPTIDPDWNFDPDVEAAIREPPSLALQQMLDHNTFAASLDALRPKHRLYEGLRQALQTYRGLEAAGGWPSLPEGAVLRPGDTDARVPALRERLAIEGDAVARSPVTEAAAYDSVLVGAVRRFQGRHGLEPDGVVGKSTLRALNVPVSVRVDQLRLSLERGRLLLHDLPDRFVFVNIPAFRAYYMDANEVRLESKVSVGKPFTKTPTFRADMTYVVINPSWTIPPGIMQRDVIPGMRKDPNYLERKGYERVGGQIVQPPGPNNALGRIKLMFPNPHHVYLHDTPQRDQFAREARTLSSGCIRVEKIVELTALVIDDPENWSQGQIEATISTGKTRNVTLKRHVPVFLSYWTAVAGLGDEPPRFYHDVYERDPAMLAALDEPFRVHPSVAARAAAVSAER
jgi:murein L,D-transpeptidase YcbB/YkuD